MRDGSKPAAWLRGIPVPIWTLGFVSMFMDISSEMIHALLPAYLVGVVGASALTVGIIEGVAEATASIVKLFSGALSDWLGKRKVLAVAGYGLAALTKPIFPLASTIGWIAAARFLDRVGKGVRGAPRDALVADLAPISLRGASFGLRQSLDTVGAFAGPSLAIALMWITSDHYQLVFWIAVIPAIIAVALLQFGVQEPERTEPAQAPRWPLRLVGLKRLGGTFWLVTGVAMLLTLARFSEAFLLLRAQGAGLSVTLVPGVLVVMNLVYMLVAYPAGLLSDRTNRINVLAAGMMLLILADLFLAIDGGLTVVVAGVALWGAHLGFTQGLLSALLADAAPVELRGTAFGIFNLVSGVALLIASVVAGVLWERYGPPATFASGAALTVVALLSLAAIRRRVSGQNTASPAQVSGPDAVQAPRDRPQR
ncbi:MFS transporter [Nitrobacter sp. NHB1]|uniref:MFS transporter n=1 Tax=Nitrobacter sp. NHB1 TaxID=3119830 RepID=UPI002FFEBDA3